MSLLIDIEESTTYRAYVRCERCDESHAGGRWWNTRAGAETSACDAAKADGWLVAGNSALCPECANSPCRNMEPCELHPRGGRQ